MLGKERKKRRKRGTGSAGGYNSYFEASVATRFPGPCITTGFFVSRQGGAMVRTSVHGKSAARAPAHTTCVCVRARQRFRALPCARGRDEAEGRCDRKSVATDCP